MKQIKEIYSRKYDNEWKSDLSVGQWDLGWLYLQRCSSDKSMKILDIGCGTGRYSHALLSNGAQCVYGVDLFDEAPFEREGFSYVQGEMDDLPFEDGFFDLIFAQSVLHYSENLDKTIAELKRTLRPGGQLYVSCHTRFSIYTLVRKVKLKFHAKSVEHLEGMRFYSTKHYLQRLKEHGFKVVRVDGWGMFLFDAFFRGIVGLSRIFHFHFDDPRKKITENRLWARFKSVVGYHFVILAQNEGRE